MHVVRLPRSKNGEQPFLDFVDQIGPKARLYGEIDHICLLRRLDFYEQNGPQSPRGRFELIESVIRLYVDESLSRYLIAHAVHTADPSTIFAVSAFYRKDNVTGLDAARSFIRSALLGPP